MTRRQQNLALMLGLLSAVLVSSLSAAETNTGAGTSGFSFLKINQGARAVGMGGAFTGLADDEVALYYNPAGITCFEDDRFVLEYHNYFEDLQSGSAGYIHPFGANKVIAFHMSYMNYGEFTQTDQAGNIEGTFGGGDLMLAATLGVRQSQQFAIGATAKFIYEKIESYSATGVAIDMGAKYFSDRERYTAGIMLQNFGTQLSAMGGGDKDPLPTIVRLGGSAKPKGLPLTLVGDVIVPFDNDIDFAIGAEYVKLKPLLLRLGWNSFGSNYRTADSKDKWAGISFGVGFEYHTMQFSYAFTPGADLGESHRITLTGGI
jgi:hypothetical protein